MGAPAAVVHAALALLLIVGAADRAHSSCNAIPAAAPTFRGTLGSTSRAFAGPGDSVRVSLDDPCHEAAPDLIGDGSDAVVTLVFTPRGGGVRNVLVLAEDCDTVSLGGCIDGARCLEVPAEPPLGPREVRFTFPDTAGLFVGTSDDLTLTGPVKIAVTRAGAPLPCGLVTGTCASETGPSVCVDRLFAGNGTCDTTPHPTFSHFTALPRANDYQALCKTVAPPCTGRENRIRMAVDADGNLLLPMNWGGILQNRGVPVGRLVRTTTAVEAFEGRDVPIRIPDASVLASFSRHGVRLSPIFDPNRDPTDPTVVTLFGTADATETVLRIARHPLVPSRQCAGGQDAGLPCAVDAHCREGVCDEPRCAEGSAVGQPCSADPDCPGSRCGPDLFDFDSRLAGGGPLVLTDFNATALDPVPLDGFSQTAELNAFVTGEAIAGTDLNGDTDTVDHVVKLGDRTTGLVPVIGPGGVRARAVLRVRQRPFTFPALALEDDLIAFLEPEPGQFAVDANADGDVADTILRLFRQGDAGAVEAGLATAVDAAPRVAGRSLALSNGRLFYRRPEAAGVPRVTGRVATVAHCPRELPPGLGRAYVEVGQPALSADGRFIAFESRPTVDLPGDPDSACGVFVLDRDTGDLAIVSLAADGIPADDHATDPTMSASGRFVAFTSLAENLLPPGVEVSCPAARAPCAQIFVRDRDADEDGVFDEADPTATRTELVSVTATGTPANGSAGTPAISADGRFVAYASNADNLAADTTPCGNDRYFLSETCYQVFVHDRVSGETVRLSQTADGRAGDGSSGFPALSADGRVVAFATLAQNFVPGQFSRDVASEVVVFDRDADQDGRLDEPDATRLEVASVGPQGEIGTASSLDPVMSADGRFVAFTSGASNLVPGDSNDEPDAFVRDRATLATYRVSVTSSGEQVNGLACDIASLLNGGPLCGSGRPAISGDGRLVSFTSSVEPAPGGGPGGDVFLHQILTGITSLESADVVALGESGRSALSADGQSLALVTGTFTDPSAADTVPDGILFVRGPAGAGGDLTGDGDSDDTIVEVFDARSRVRTTLCAATEVAVADGIAAFLRPEAPAGNLVCPGGSLNATDLDTDDLVVQLWRGGRQAENLGCAAAAVAVSNQLVAALVSEDGEGESDLNGDRDSDDTVLQVRRLDAAAWTNVGEAGDELAVAGAVVAFATGEAAQGADLNEDGDLGDRVLQVYDATAGTLTNVGLPVEDFVIGGTGLVAFRTTECHQAGAETDGCPTGGTDLNGDGDAADDVLATYDPGAGVVCNSGQAVTPCFLEACDPRVPYRVLRNTVTFLAFEADQGADLSGDGQVDDLVLQTFNVALAEGAGACLPSTPLPSVHAQALGRRTAAAGVTPGLVTTLAAATAGVCTTTGAACASDADCAGGTCFVPPGGCLVRVSAAPCSPLVPDACGRAGDFCLPEPGDTPTGTCHRVEGPCRSTADCVTPGATCSVGDQDFQRLVNPLTQRDGGSSVFTGAGRCIEHRATPCALGTDCTAGEFCDDGTCHREHGVCARPEDCPAGVVCRRDLVIHTLNDADEDELPDVADNCPETRNVLQQDTDGDGVGDACDKSACPPSADGVACDDGNPCTTGDVCRAGACTGPVGCDDGRFCNGAEVCDPSQGCRAATPPVLDDGIACTVDRCDETARQVVHAASDEACADGDVCNGTETCDPGAGCVAGTPLACADEDACTADRCEARAGCGHLEEAADTPAGVTCSVANLEVLVSSPQPICATACTRSLDRRLERVSTLLRSGADASTTGRCRRRLRAATQVAHDLERRVRKLGRRAQSVAPEWGARMRAEAARLRQRAAGLARSTYCRTR